MVSEAGQSVDGVNAEVEAAVLEVVRDVVFEKVDGTIMGDVVEEGAD